MPAKQDCGPKAATPPTSPQRHGTSAVAFSAVHPPSSVAKSRPPPLHIAYAPTPPPPSPYTHAASETPAEQVDSLTVAPAASETLAQPRKRPKRRKKRKKKRKGRSVPSSSLAALAEANISDSGEPKVAVDGVRARRVFDVWLTKTSRSFFRSLQWHPVLINMHCNLYDFV